MYDIQRLCIFIIFILFSHPFNLMNDLCLIPFLFDSSLSLSLSQKKKKKKKKRKKERNHFVLHNFSILQAVSAGALSSCLLKHFFFI